MSAKQPERGGGKRICRPVSGDAMDRESEISGATAFPFERRCPECGKVFSGVMLETWTYRDKGQLLCSWGCVRQREKKRAEAELKRKAKLRKKLTPAQKEALIRKYVFRGMSNEEISEETGISQQLVNYYRKKIEEGMDG